MRANFVMSGVGIGIKRNATMTIALVLSTAIALAFVGAAILTTNEISKFKSQYEGSLNVSVFLCATVNNAPCQHKTTPAETAALRTKLENDPLISSVNYVSERQQYRRATALQSKDVAKFTKVGDLPASFTLKLVNIQRDYVTVARDYSDQPGVFQVNNQQATVRALLDIIDAARLLAIVIALIVLIASILLIGNTIQVAAAQRKNETSIMRLVGASRWMTELPFMIETIVATAVGGLIAFGMVAIGKHYVLSGVFANQTRTGVIPNLNVNDLLVASGLGLIGGIVLSAMIAIGTLRLYVRL